MFWRFFLVSALIGSVGCSAGFVSYTNKNSVDFFYSSSSTNLHIWLALVLLIAGLWIPSLLRNQKKRFRGFAYSLLVIVFLGASSMNLYAYWVKKSFKISIRPEIVQIEDIWGRSEIPWEDLFEVERADRVYIPGLDKITIMDKMNKCFKFIGRNKVIRVVPDSFTDEDRDLFLKLLLGKDVIISDESRIK